MLKILLVEANTKKAREESVAMGNPTQSALYQKKLEFLEPGIKCEIITPADVGSSLPSGEDLEKYDGILWTGSSLNIYHQTPEITQQIDFMRECFKQNVKIFGSCWGLQIAVVAAGGTVEKNNKGREIGIAYDIKLTSQGRSHPIYRGKESCFNAVAVHLDHAVGLPDGATILSGNDMSDVQAIEIKQGNAVFWGVQYHPEFDLHYMAGLLEKYKKTMIDEGIKADAAAVDSFADDFRKLHNSQGAESLCAQYKVGQDILNPYDQMREIGNWLNYIKVA